jgi:hypothetical protein
VLAVIDGAGSSTGGLACLAGASGRVPTSSRDPDSPAATTATATGSGLMVVPSFGQKRAAASSAAPHVGQIGTSRSLQPIAGARAKLATRKHMLHNDFLVTPRTNVVYRNHLCTLR